MIEQVLNFMNEIVFCKTCFSGSYHYDDLDCDVTTGGLNTALQYFSASYGMVIKFSFWGAGKSISWLWLYKRTAAILPNSITYQNIDVPSSFT